MQRPMYALALGIAAAGTLFLLFGIGALGVIGAEGDSADAMFLAVLAIGLVGAVVTRLRPAGMVWTMGAMAVATMTVGIIAIARGEHESDVTSVPEILGLTGMFAALFVASAWCFRRSTAPHRPPATA